MGDCCSSEVTKTEDPNTVPSAKRAKTKDHTNLYTLSETSMSEASVSDQVDEYVASLEEEWENAVLKNDNLKIRELFQAHHKKIRFFEIRFDNDDTSLHCAARQGNLKLVKFFLILQMNINVINRKNGNTALHVATESNRINVIKLLLRNNPPSDITIRNHKNETAIDMARRLSNNKILNLLNNHLHDASQQQQQPRSTSLQAGSYSVDDYHSDGGGSSHGHGHGHGHGGNRNSRHSKAIDMIGAQSEKRGIINHSNNSIGELFDTPQPSKQGDSDIFGSGGDTTHLSQRELIGMGSDSSIHNNGHAGLDMNDSRRDRSGSTSAESAGGGGMGIGIGMASGSSVGNHSGIEDFHIGDEDEEGFDDDYDKAKGIIIKGFLDEKRHRAPHNWKRKWVVVHPPNIFINDKRMDNIEEMQKKCKTNIDFSQISTVTSKKSEKVQNKFVINLKHGDPKEYIFRCHTQTVRDTWVVKLNDSLSTYLKSQVEIVKLK